jgi:hypothetical protein
VRAHHTQVGVGRGRMREDAAVRHLPPAAEAAAGGRWAVGVQSQGGGFYGNSCYCV